MVVILLLPPYSTNGCDGRSNESSSPATSTTSTGETAIHNIDYNLQQQQVSNSKSLEDYNNNNQQIASSYYYTAPPPEPPPPLLSATATTAEYYPYRENVTPQHYNAATALSENTTSHYKYSTVSPPPPPLPKSKPPTYVAARNQQEEFLFYNQNVNTDPRSNSIKICANIVPKPPRCRAQSHPTLATIPEHSIQQQQPMLAKKQPPPTAVSTNTPTSSTANVFHKVPSSNNNNKNYLPLSNSSKSKTFTNSNYTTNTTNYVRHVTRVNFYDIDTSQVEYESKDYDGDDNDNLTLDDDNNTEALTKEEEWITKRKTELTTTRQIETHVKRQVVFEDGKVIEDSGPIVSTNTTEDTDKQETETTEKRDLGLPVALNPNDINKHKGALQYGKDTAARAAEDGGGGELAELENAGGTLVKSIVPRPADGLVREINEKRVVTHEEIKDYIETEDVKHMGDFSDESSTSTSTSTTEKTASSPSPSSL
ncbi:hypothetical protein FF38_11258 [Lucilia cuprina]|uniref:Uncharacterized protein n=1 Tax=Lucilia cuprina TaxID=7375 RepID=A0A0L0BNK4_LUCCU|nr:hypothetical protein FF38_11258 [Lucilia cuprina]